MVISARASEVSSDHLRGETINVKLKEGQQLVKKTYRELFNYMWFLSEADFENFMLLNKDKKEILVGLKEGLFKDTTVRRLLVLLEHDGKPWEELLPKDWECCIVKTGHAELAIEFLLSKFCHAESFDWYRRDDPSVKYQPDEDDEIDLLRFLLPEIDPLVYKKVWKYEFVNSSDLSELVEYWEYYDEDGGLQRNSDDYYYFSVNLKALDHLRHLIYVPSRVQEILTDEQSRLLEAQVPEILMGELDYIARSVLLQEVDSYRADRIRAYGEAMSQEWSSGMYEVLGGMA